MSKVGSTQRVWIRRFPRKDTTEALLRCVAILLVAVFAAAAMHELFFILLGHEHKHQHETCPFCQFLQLPVFLYLFLVALARYYPGRCCPIPSCETPLFRCFVFRIKLRGPPSL